MWVLAVLGDPLDPSVLEIEFKEKERSMRPSASKRRYIEVDSESDLESDFDSTMNHSQDSSCLNDSLNESFGSRGANYWKQRALAAEGQLKAEKLAREAKLQVQLLL